MFDFSISYVKKYSELKALVFENVTNINIAKLRLRTVL